MAVYFLILLAVTRPGGSYEPHALSTLSLPHGFATKAACEAAGVEAERGLTASRDANVSYACVTAAD